MLKLKITYIPLDVVKGSKALQGIECKNYWFKRNKDGIWLTTSWRELALYEDDTFVYGLEYPAPTIADVIDNAEMLFGDGRKNEWGSYEKYIIMRDNKWKQILMCEKHKAVSFNIIDMCQQDKSITEIAEYIIKNLK